MNDIVEILERELSQLETELRRNPTFVKIERIRQLIDVYRGTAPAPAPVPPRAAQSAHKPVTSAPKPVSKRMQISEAITEALKANGPMHRKDLLRMMINRGLMGTEKNPMQSMAIYLSDAKNRFRSLGNGRWDLQTVEEAQSTNSNSSEAAMPPRSNE